MPAAEPRVVVVGDANPDLLIVVPPEGIAPGQLPPPVMTGGGSASNTAVALARLGVPVDFIGTVGDDDFGRIAREDLERAGVDCSGLAADPSLGTVCVVAVVDASGERRLAAWGFGAPSFKSLDPAAAERPALREAAWVHTSGMILPEDGDTIPTVSRILREARERGAPTSIDLNLRGEPPATAAHLARIAGEILEHCSYVLGSGPDEFSVLGPGSWLENARALVRDDRAVVVRDGAAGATLIEAAGESAIPAPEVRVVDTVGAGDVFDAGFIAGILETGSTRQGMRWATAVAAASVGAAGARGTPDRAALRSALGA